MIDAEVLLYVGKLAKYLDTNKNAREHFVGDLNREEFMDNVTLVAMKNYSEKQDPTLSMQQFEEIRMTMREKTGLTPIDVIKEIVGRDESYYEPIIYIDKRGLETIKIK